MSCSVWVYLWKTVLVSEFLLLKQNSWMKEIGGQQLLILQLLAVLDCSIATAHYAQIVAEAEKLTPITIYPLPQVCCIA